MKALSGDLERGIGGSSAPGLPLSSRRRLPFLGLRAEPAGRRRRGRDRCALRREHVHDRRAWLSSATRLVTISWWWGADHGVPPRARGRGVDARAGARGGGAQGTG